MKDGPPRVAHVVISLVHGGLEHCAALWCGARNKRYLESTSIVCLDEPGPLAATLAEGSVRALRANRSRFPWDCRAVADLRHLLRSHAIDVVHSHNVAARQYAALARVPGVVHVNTEHGTNRHSRGMVNRLRYCYMRRRTDMVVAVSTGAANAFRAAFPVRDGELTVIENGVDTRCRVELSSTELRRRHGIPEGACLLGCVGRLSVEKGVDRLIDALGSIVSERAADSPDWRLAVVGDGAELAMLQRRSEARGVLDRVHFVGAVPDAGAMMHMFDLLVIPSRSEGLPLVLLEAMVARVPILTTDVGENRAVIENGACGRLLPDAESRWPETIVRVLDEQRRGALRPVAERAGLRVAANYSLDRTLDRYETLYGRLMQGGVPSSEL